LQTLVLWRNSAAGTDPGNRSHDGARTRGVKDGTISFLSALLIPPAFAILEKALSNLLGEQVAALTYWTIDQMTQITHEVGTSPFILIRSPNVSLPKAEMAKLHGGLIAFEVMDKTGEYVSCEVIESAASLKGISLQAGCMW
jgi:hypothetical protein